MHLEPNEPPDDRTWVQCNDLAQNDSATLEGLYWTTNSLSVSEPTASCTRSTATGMSIRPPWANKVEHDEVGTWQFQAAGEGVQLRATVEATPDCWQHVTCKLPDDSLRYNALTVVGHCHLQP